MQLFRAGLSFNLKVVMVTAHLSKICEFRVKRKLRFNKKYDLVSLDDWIIGYFYNDGLIPNEHIKTIKECDALTLDLLKQGL